MPADAATDQVYRLEDIEVEEVSVVDRAANARKFLVVKSEDGAMKKTVEVTTNGKGGHTIAKDDAAVEKAPGVPPTGAPAAAAPAAGAPGAAPAAAPAPAPGAAPGTAPTMALSPEAKAELMKRVDGGMTRLAAIKSLLESATETAGATEIPAEVVTAFGDVLHLLAEGGDDAATAAPAAKSATAAIAKGRKQISIIREEKLRAAHAALGTILSELEAPAATTDEPPAVPEVTPAPAVASPEVTKAIADVGASVTKLESSVTKALGSILTIVEAQKAAIAKAAEQTIDRGRKPGNGERTEVDKGDKGAPEPATSWPIDMSNPGHGDHAPGNRFSGSR